VRVAVVGGGITGLSLAHYLTKERARAGGSAELGEPIECTVLEAAPRLGGKIRTVEEEGFRIEGGPDSFVSRKPHALDLARELGLEERLLPATRGKNVYVVRDGALVALPRGMRLIVPTEAVPFLRSPLLSPAGRIRALAERYVPHAGDARHAGDESIASFARRRFGGEMLSRLAEPLMAGIHLGDPERLSMGSAFPHYLRMEREHGSLIRAMRAAAGAPGARGAATGVGGGISFTSFVGGMGELVTALDRSVRARATVRTEAKVTRMSREGAATETNPGQVANGSPGYTLELASGESLHADLVVLTVGAWDAAELLKESDPRRAAVLRELRAVSSATVSMAFRKGEELPELNGTGFVVPRREGRVLRGCSWSSSKFAHRAPDGMKLLRVFLGGAGEEELVERSDEELGELAGRELADLIGLEAEPDLRMVFRYPSATPQYQVGHAARIAELDGMPRNGVFLAGTSYRGVGIPDCVKDAMETAQRVIAYNTGVKSEEREL